MARLGLQWYPFASKGEDVPRDTEPTIVRPTVAFRRLQEKPLPIMKNLIFQQICDVRPPPKKKPPRTPHILENWQKTHTQPHRTQRPKQRHKRSRGKKKRTILPENTPHATQKKAEREKTKEGQWQRQKENRQYIRKRYFQEGKTRDTVINMKKGMGALTIAIINPDHFVANQVQQDITQQLPKKKIHIEIIQETHIPRDLNYEINGYRIITSAATPNPRKTPEHDIPGKYIDGAEIALHHEMAPHISSIQRINHRILKITLGRPETHTHH